MSAYFIADSNAAFCVLDQNEVPAAESIERWREWMLSTYRKSCGIGRDGEPRTKSEQENFINRIFDYAQLGRDKHADIRAMAQQELAATLRSIARQVNTKGRGKNLKGTVKV